MTGNGNDTHSINLSQFDPSIGTLVSAKINSTVSLNYGFTLKNVDSTQKDFSVNVGRYDHFSSAALTSPYTNVVDTGIGSFLLNPGDSVTKQPYTLLYRYSQNDSITSNTVSFLGNNMVNYSYVPITYTNLTGSNVYYYSASANDTIRFSVTYYYCTNAILANNIISFSAEKENTDLVKLLWSTNQAESGNEYEIQVGGNGTQFFTIASLPSELNDNSYTYYYKISNNERGKLYFRLKVISQSGSITYSEIKTVDLNNTNNAQAFVYPNPSKDYINLAIENGAWDVTIFSAIGNIIQQDHFENTSLPHINFKSQLVSGTYFIRAESFTLKKQYVLKFAVK